jgi:hypothetical protein
MHFRAQGCQVQLKVSADICQMPFAIHPICALKKASYPVRAKKPRVYVGEINFYRRQSYKTIEVFKKSKLVLKSLIVSYLNLDHKNTVLKS